VDSQALRARAGEAATEGQGLRSFERLVGVDDVHHRVDEGEMGERLREVAQVAVRPRVDLLRVLVSSTMVPGR